MLAPPGDAAVAELADRQAAPLDDRRRLAAAGADRPVGEHDVSPSTASVCTSNDTGVAHANDCSTMRRYASMPSIDATAGQREHHVVVPALEVRVDVGREPRGDAAREHRARVLDRDAHDERRTNPSTSVRSRSHTAASSSGAPASASFALAACVRATASDASIDVGLGDERDDLLDLGPVELAAEQVAQLGRRTRARR